MSTAASPVPRSHPPSQQVRPASPARPPHGRLPRWACTILAAPPGLYGIVRGITLWPELPTLPRRRAWLGWMQVGLTVVFVSACLVVAWPKV